MKFKPKQMVKPAKPLERAKAMEKMARPRKVRRAFAKAKTTGELP